jgi:cyanophycin synthetase
MQEVVVFGMRKETQRAWLPVKKGSKKYRWHYFESIPIPPWLDQYGIGWVDDKYSLKKIFTKNNLPVAKGAAVVSKNAAVKMLQNIGTSVITKPREGSRGRHTTVDISSSEELIKAFTRSQQLCPFVIVEEFIPGNIYRATCIGKKVVGVMELVRPHIVADGSMTISELRNYHNTHGKKFPELTDVQEDALFYNTILHQGYTLTSIPEKGKDVLLAEFSERTNGGYFIDLTDEIPASTIATIERAAEVSGVDVNGFDIISRDLANPSERFVFIEGNTLPYIEIHDIPYAGKVRNPSGAIFDLWM